jgi:hypothetical protein
VSVVFCGLVNNVAITSLSFSYYLSYSLVSGEPYIWGRVGNTNYLVPNIIVELNTQIIQSMIRGMFQNMAIVSTSLLLTAPDRL